MALSRLALSRSALDRRAEVRSEPGVVERLAADPSTVLVPVHDGRVPVTDGPDGPRLPALPAAGHRDLLGDGPVILLGFDAAGSAHLAVPVPDETLAVEPSTRWAGLRELGAVLDDTGVGALTTATALLAWHARHGRCSVCGEPTRVVQAGWVRHCPACGAEHYPRTDPAVIMTVADADDRLLLGRQAAWPEGRYSTLAGFVEPGESLEDAVRREVHEESAVVVGDVTYLGSQPWPFPASLMVGFHGTALTTDVTVDGAELAQAGWWSRAELAAAVAAGDLRLPPGVSIARRLIEHWYGGPIEGSADAWR